MKVYTFQEMTGDIMKEAWDSNKPVKIDSKRKLVLIFKKGEKPIENIMEELKWWY